MPYGYTDEQWNKMDAFTKFRIQSQAQTSMKQAPKAQAKPKTTTTTPKTTTTSTSATQPTQGSAATAAATYSPTLTDMNTAANTTTSTSGSGPLVTYEYDAEGNIVGATGVMPEPSRGNIAAPTLKNLGYITGEFEYNPLTGTYTDTMTDHATGVTTTDQGRVSNPYADMLAEIERRQRELAEAQRQSRIAALGKQKEQALSSLQAEEAALKPYYYDLRNRTAAQSDIAAKNFAEYMAAQGIRGSAAGLPEIYRQSALQGQLGTLNRQEAADIADIARRRSGVESAYEYDVAAAMADIDAQTLQNYIDNMRIIQAQKVADLAAQGKTSTGELTLQGREAQQNELARQAALLAARYYDDIQAYINTLDPNDPLVPYLYAERRKKMQAEAEKAAAAAAAASEAEQQRWKNAFETFKATGRITSPEQAQILGLPMGATVADVDIARMNAQTARMNAQTSAYNAQQRTQQQEDQAASQRIQQYADIIDRLYVNTQYDNDGRAIGKTFDPNTVKAYIKNLHQTGQISDDEARQLLGMYGFTF